MIEETLARWHQHLRGQLPGGLDALLQHDVVFYSPIVFSPQRGKELTEAYLGAASETFGGDQPAEGGGGEGGGFRYVKEVAVGNQAILEFETKMGDTYVNGVDIITCDDDGLITEFKVMIRPLQAVNLVHERMRTMLELMAGEGAPDTSG
jgi:hypothetical protein